MKKGTNTPAIECCGPKFDRCNCTAMLIAIKAPKMSTRARNHNPKLTQLRIIAMVFATESFHNGWRERERERRERERREERGE